MRITMIAIDLDRPMIQNAHLSIKMLVPALAFFLIGCVVVPATTAQPTPAPETSPQTIPAQLYPNIQGEWKLSIIGENLASTYSLIQKGSVLTGTFRAPMGNFPITGTITKDNKINFSAKAGGMNLKFAGTVDGKTMKGVADIPMKGRRDWTATR